MRLVLVGLLVPAALAVLAAAAVHVAPGTASMSGVSGVSTYWLGDPAAERFHSTVAYAVVSFLRLLVLGSRASSPGTAWSPNAWGGGCRPSPPDC